MVILNNDDDDEEDDDVDDLTDVEEGEYGDVFEPEALESGERRDWWRNGFSFVGAGLVNAEDEMTRL